MEVIRLALDPLRSSAASNLRPFLNPGVTLVPVPRSAPLSAGALWPAKVLAEVLVSEGFGAEVLPCVRRVAAVPKSSSSPAGERPLVHAHYSSLAVEPDLIAPTEITLIDDVLTMGRTALACAQRLNDVFPQTLIRVFAISRTLGLVPEIELVVEPTVGTITGYPSGKTHREP